ncbi:TonB-dependent receptor plug domain-containing protein [Pseudoduganella sp. OTU4001]|uniref:TonB-dependent receptor plug domain-containing protein n=1 Tax=Pseudoduganella sp. OTU4001 TaxID=3043854 RepID=UPI00313CCD5C
MKLKLIACAAMVFARAYAQETPPVVQIKASADLQRQRDTASRTTITREEILKFGDASALDVLKRLPGVSVGEGGPRMRGLGAGYTQVLVNGDRPPPGFSLENLAPDMIDKIEIMRSATAEFSTQAVAGTINIVLRKSASKLSRDWRASATIPSSRPLRSAGLGLADKDETSSYTFNASVSQGNNHLPEHTYALETASDGTVRSQREENQSSRNRFLFFNINGRLNWTLAPGETLGWQTFATVVRFHADRATDAHLTGGFILPFARFDYWRKDSGGTLRSELNWSRKLENGGAIESKLGLSGDNPHTARISSIAARPGTRTLDRLYDVHAASRRANWTGKFSLPAMGRHSLSLGWDVVYGRQRDQELQEDTAAIAAGALDFDRTSRARLRNLAAFVQNEWDVGDGWSLYAGLRRETSTTHSSGSDYAGATTTAGVTSPILQALWKLPGEQRRQLRFAVARTYKAPSTNQLIPRRFLSMVNTELAPDSSGNPALKPELARGFDLAFEAYGSDGALFSLSAGTRRISDVIFSAVVLKDGRWVSSPSNFGGARTDSVEVEWKGLVPGTPLRFSFNGGRHWSRVDAVPGPDNRLARQPRWTANAGGEYRAGPWGAGANIAYTATGWVQITKWQSVYNGVQRSVEGYASYRSSPASQWRLTGGSLLRQPSLSRSIYADANGRMENVNSVVNPAWLRVSYERQF